MPSSRSISFLKRNGIEYVDINEFCRRKEITKPSFYYYRKKGWFNEAEIDGRMYIEWESSSKMLDEQHRKTNVGKKRKNADRKEVEIKKVSDVGSAEETEIKEEVIAELSDGKETYQIEKIDFSQFSDCYKKVNRGGQFVVDRDANGKPIMDWNLFDQRARAMIHYQQYQTKNGDLIPKDDVVTVLSSILTPLRNDIQQIPERYSSQFLACLERAEISVPNALNTELRKILADTSEKILRDLIDKIDETLENGNGTENS